MKKINNYKKAKKLFQKDENVTISTFSENAKFVYVNGEKINFPFYIIKK